MSKLITVLILVVFNVALFGQKSQSYQELERSATRHFAQGQYENAISDFTRIIEMTSSLDTNSNKTSVDELNRLGKVNALSDRKISVLDPRTAVAYVNRARAYAAMGQNRYAFDDFERAIRITPSLSQAYFFRGNLYLEEEKFESAVADFDKFIKLLPDRFEGFVGRGMALVGLGRSDRALEDLDTAVKLSGKNAVVHYFRGEALRKLGDFKKAIVEFETASQIDPKLPEPHLGRGLIHLHFEELEKAIVAFSAAIERNDRSAKALANRGLTYLGVGKTVEANADFTRLAIVDPEMRADLEATIKRFSSMKRKP